MFVYSYFVGSLRNARKEIAPRGLRKSLEIHFSRAKGAGRFVRVCEKLCCSTNSCRMNSKHSRKDRHDGVVELLLAVAGFRYYIDM